MAQNVFRSMERDLKDINELQRRLPNNGSNDAGFSLAKFFSGTDSPR